MLGCVLRHETAEGVTAGIIVETEAYLGEEDEASHARFGRTPRSSILFGPPGIAYVYLVYGMHYMLNAVAEVEGKAGAVLIRALEPTEGVALMAARRGIGAGKLATPAPPPGLASGPARLTRALGITLEHNGLPLTAGALGIFERVEDGRFEVLRTERIGVGGSADLRLRFVIKGNTYVSR
jgi:DNA-3-methyladenine glycosylase